MTRIVVLGGGFAGVNAAVDLSREFRLQTDVDILMIGEHNYFLFTPLLPQIASSYTNPRHIVQPVRDIRGSRRFRFRRDTVRALDLDRRQVVLADGTPVEYHYLVVATGSRTDHFGIPGAREHTLEFKSLEDAVRLREHVIDLCEHADHAPDPATRRRLLTFAVVGGGYTGVELIAELQDFLFQYVARSYRGIAGGEIRLVLVEAAGEILQGLHPDLARHAGRRLRQEGIQIRIDARVTRCFPGGIEINGSEVLDSETVVWSAGVRAHELVDSLPCRHDRRGRALVNAYLQIPDRPEVFVIGDSASAQDADAPQVAPVAIEHGRLAARNIARLVHGRPLEAYAYQRRGMLVSLGMNHAVVGLGGLRLGGYFAWLLWNAAHLYKLVGLKRQLQVALDWWLAYFFPRDSTIVRRRQECRFCAGVRRLDGLDGDTGRPV